MRRKMGLRESAGRNADTRQIARDALPLTKDGDAAGTIWICQTCAGVLEQKMTREGNVPRGLGQRIICIAGNSL
jgi:hypothetical protein